MAVKPMQATADYIIGTLLAADTTLKGTRDSNNPPESIPAFPFKVCYPGSGEWDGGAAGEKKGRHIMIVEIHIARKEMTSDMDKAYPYGDTVPDRFFADPDLGGTVDTIVPPIAWSFGLLNWGDQQTIGWRFEVPYKVRSNTGSDIAV